MPAVLKVLVSDDSALIRSSLNVSQANGTIDGDDLELDKLPNTQDEAATATDQGPVPSDRRLASTIVVVEDKGRSEASRTQCNELRTGLPEYSRMPQRVGRREAEHTGKGRR